MVVVDKHKSEEEEFDLFLSSEALLSITSEKMPSIKEIHLRPSIKAYIDKLENNNC